MMNRRTMKTGWVAFAVLVAGVASSAEIARLVESDEPVPASPSTPIPGTGRMQSLSVPAATSGEARTIGDARASLAPPIVRAAAQRSSRVSAVQIGSGRQGQQSMTVRGSSGTFEQRQAGGGNRQILEVESTTGGTVTQRQSGSGNSQSMSIGVTDQRPSVVPGVSIQ